jgi:hypothetical protein
LILSDVSSIFEEIWQELLDELLLEDFIGQLLAVKIALEFGVHLISFSGIIVCKVEFG